MLPTQSHGLFPTSPAETFVTCFDTTATCSAWDEVQVDSKLGDAGDTIIKQGDADRSLFKFYIVEEGTVEAYVTEDGEEILMSHLSAGPSMDHLWLRVCKNCDPR